MKKYLTVFKTQLQHTLTHRADFFGYRIANIFEILIQIVVWSAIFGTTQQVGGYNYSEMITYIVVGRAFSFFTANFGLEHVIARQIQFGELSNFIVKPMSYLKYLVSMSTSRSALGLISAIITSLILIVIFSNYIIAPQNPALWLLIIAMLILGYLTHLFITILIGFIAFWTVDISGIFFSVKALEKFAAGVYFPLNLLPAAFVNFSLALPFAYTFYFPIQLFLGKTTIHDGLIGLAIQIAWLLALYFMIKGLWRLGLKKYESVGI
ncbi:MAG: ABC-2 family transporter protein [Parcubacteria group bacterium]|jgi:ABC-2 type transport system permease protein